MRTKKAKLIANLCSFAAVITATQFCVVSCSSNSTVQDKPGTEQNPEIKENPNAEEYNVSIKANQGGKLEITINGENETTTSFRKKLPKGTQIQIKAVADDGFTFEKWNDDVTNDSRTLNIEKDCDLVAIFNQIPSLNEEKPIVKKHKLSIVSKHAKVRLNNNNANEPYSTELSEGQGIIIDLDDIEFGYKFVEWSDGNKETSRPYIMACADTTLTAIFEEIEYHNLVISKEGSGTISVLDENNKLIKSDNDNANFSHSFPLGTKLKIKVNPDKTNGYEFKGWKDSSLLEEVKDEYLITIGKNDINLIAEFGLIEFDVNIKAENGGKVLINIDGHSKSVKSFNEQIQWGKTISITPQPDNNYAFAHWNNDPQDKESPKVLTILENTNVVAYFVDESKVKDVFTETENQSFKLDIPQTVKGKYKVDDIEIVGSYNNTFKENTDVKIEAFPYEGYVFSKWSDGETENPRSITMDSNKEISAIFDYKEYKLDIRKSTVGSVKLNNEVIKNYPCIHSFNVTTYPTIEAIANDGYKFESWSDGVTNNPRTITNSKTIKALFVYDKYKLTVKKPEIGSIKLNNEIIRNYPCEHLFNIVTYPTIEAVPAIGYKFVNWSDGVTDSKRTITENMTVSANFEEIKEHKVQFSTSEGGQLYVTAKNWTKFAHSKYSIDDNLAEGSKVSLDVKPSKGYKFVKWIGNVHVDENKKDGYSFIVGDSDIRLTAIFDRIKHNVSISADNSGQFALTIDGKTEEMSSFNEEIPEDTLISIKLITPRWYAFKRWKGDGISLLSGNEDDGYSLVVGEEDINLTAHFEKISDGILTIPKMAGGTIKVNDEEVNTPYKHKFNYEEKVTIEAIPDEEEGYYFKGWNDLWNADSETIPTKRTIEITRDKTVFACFTNGILCKRAIWNANIKDAIQVPTKFFMSSGYTDPINENAKSNYIVCKMAARYSAHLLNDKNMYIDPLTGKTYDVLMVSSHGSGVDISPQQYKDPSAAVLNFTTCQELIDRIFDGLEGRDVESAYFNEENRQERPGFVWAKNRNGNWQPFVVKEIESGAFDYICNKQLKNYIDCDVIIPWTVDCVGSNAFQRPNLFKSKKLHVIYANRTCVDKNNVSYWEGVRNDEMDWSNSESWDEKVEILYDATRDRWTFPTVISKHGEKELTKFIPIQK